MSEVVEEDEPSEHEKPEDHPGHPHDTPPGHDPDFVPPGQVDKPEKPDKPEEPEEDEPHPAHPIVDPEAPYVDPRQA